jgi:hypothetical protein
MNNKIDWMLGMTENMMNLTLKHTDKPMMGEMYSMTSAMMGNLNHMKVMNFQSGMIDMMEPMMRSMEEFMMHMDVNNDSLRSMMKNMMSFMIMMQMSMIMSSMSQK